jgi:hypothetical protein
MQGQALYTVFYYNLMPPSLNLSGPCICAVTHWQYSTNDEIALSRLPAKTNTSQSYANPLLRATLLANETRPIGHATSFDVSLLGSRRELRRCIAVETSPHFPSSALLYIIY